MRCGLFGKLPSKRDFVALAAPREFLGVWEPWIQGAISASRVRLGKAWQEAYLRAPIWRFWLGQEICGATVLGAFMPSVDGVGRYFPLTAFACAQGGPAIPPPELDPQEGWFAGAEELLLSALDRESSFDALAIEFQELRPPNLRPSASPEAMRLPDGTVAAPGSRPLPELFAALRAEDHARAYAAATFWWTAGGEGYGPRALVGHRLPDPYAFTGMLTGRFDAAFA